MIRGEYLIALDPRSGQPIASFGEKGRVNLRPGLGPLATNYSWTGARRSAATSSSSASGSPR